MDGEKTRGQRALESFQELAAEFEAMTDGEVLARLGPPRFEWALEPRTYTGPMVKAVRRAVGVGQSVFARFLGVTTTTVSAWERETKPVGRLAARFLDEMHHAPDHFAARVRDALVRKRPAAEPQEAPRPSLADRGAKSRKRAAAAGDRTHAAE